MTLWLVRAGRNGAQESLALDQGLAVIGWNELSDLLPATTRDRLEAMFRAAYPDDNPNRVANQVGQLWAFRDRIQLDDLVILPLKSRSAIAIGRVTGPYAYRPDLPDDSHHTRAVEWLRKDIPRSAFDQDLLYSLGAFMTVCQIQRNSAEPRIRAILAGKRSTAPAPISTGEPSDAAVGVAVPADLEQYARDGIREHIGRRFKGHELARLVAAILSAQGYHTFTSPPGADGGVDIIAGRGPMGFDAPRLCVQVKSSEQPIDVSALRELQGVLKQFGADQGLFVSWGGFRQSVLSESRRLFFEIRLWDAGNLVDALLEEYDRLPVDLQAELPLKQIWTLVLEE